MGIQDFTSEILSGIYTVVHIPSAIPSYVGRISELKKSYGTEDLSSLNLAGRLAGIALGTGVGNVPYIAMAMGGYWFPAIVICAATNIMSGTLSLGGLENVVDSVKDE